MKFKVTGSEFALCLCQYWKQYGVNCDMERIDRASDVWGISPADGAEFPLLWQEICDSFVAGWKAHARCS